MSSAADEAHLECRGSRWTEQNSCAADMARSNVYL